MELAINDSGQAGVIINNEFKLFDKTSVRVRKEFQHVVSRYDGYSSFPKHCYLTFETYKNNPKITSNEIDMLYRDNEFVYKFYQAMVKLQVLLNQINQMEEYIANKRTRTQRCFMDADYETLYKLYDDLNDFKYKNTDINLQYDMTQYGYGDCIMGLE